MSLLKNLKPVLFFLLSFYLFSCKHTTTVFEQIKSSQSGIHFNNLIVENDSINQLDNGNVFNGGGVGIGDFNNDGLPDIYFTGNLTACKLYLNEGDFSFQDVTDEANVTGEGKWCRGVAVVDINNDGWQDIYVSATIWKSAEKRKNLLYINQGSDSGGVPKFKEMAAEYGLDDDSHTTQAAFFDYDNDGDLDVYLTVNEVADRNSPYVFHPIVKDGSNSSTGKLLRNDFSSSLNHPVFTDVSKQAGIQTEGYGNQASITDINLDGWKDIYVSNDYLSNDLLWINNRNGTFTEMLSFAFKHTSNSAMGNDVGDINNDGLMDFITLDMNPEDNYRKKMMLPPASYQFFQNSEQFGYNFQYIRNTLQLNQGLRPDLPDSTTVPVFGEIAYFAGVEATDWSWTPLLTDFDNDGYNDLFIANGFPRDITDRDFGMFRNKAWATTSKADILKQIPEVKIHNYLYRNNSNLTFTDMSAKWGLSAPTFSNGAAYADFDKDGDLDLVINNINDEASVYRNNSREIDQEKSHYLDVELQGDDANRNGLGAWVEIYYNQGRKQVWENAPFRGYLSTVEPKAHFGLGAVQKLDSVVVRWPNGKKERLTDVSSDQILKLSQKAASARDMWGQNSLKTNAVFKDVTASKAINYSQQETDFVDFNIQKLIPHKLSEYGPALVSGDVNGDGLDDLVSGGSAGNSAQIFIQKKDGTFTQKSLLPDSKLQSKTWDDMGILLFDADADGDQDLYLASGGYENDPGSAAYSDHFYLNNGSGNFIEKENALPENLTSKSCVRAADFDKDGDLDLFVAGRVDPSNYPKPVSSFIYRNDSKNGTVSFTDVTKDVAAGLNNLGLVCDALFTDFNNDGSSDLILTGEWMPITFLANENGIFRDVTASSGISSHTGWWNSITAGDFDNDGDMDYVVGNLGQNSFFRASDKYPASIIASDFDNNGSYDAFPALYIRTSQQDSAMKNYPAHGRDDIVKQMIKMRSKFQNYKSQAVSTIDQMFTEKQIQGALKLTATDFKSSYCRNDGGNHFTLIALPVQAQLSAVNGMVTDDFDNDGNLDVLINCNDYSTDVLVGRYDASNGLLLKGNGKGDFAALSIAESGIFVPGNGKALVKFRGAGGNYLVAAAQNRGMLKVFELEGKGRIVPLKADETSAELLFQDGHSRKQEFAYGSSFLSQSARFINAGDNLKSVSISGNKGQIRTISF